MKKLLIAVALWGGLVGGAWARTIEQQLLASLQAQGYVILEQGYTFLGRLRIVAQNGDIRREIVVNPGTGEILRDYASMLPKAPAFEAPQTAPGAAASVASTTGPGTAGGTVAGGVGTATTLTGGDGTIATGTLATGTMGATADPVPNLTGDDDAVDGGEAPVVILVDPLLTIQEDAP